LINADAKTLNENEETCVYRQRRKSGGKLMTDLQNTDADDSARIHVHADKEKYGIVARKKVEARRMLEDALEEIRQRQAEWNAG
jgi:hypothetical protein